MYNAKVKCLSKDGIFFKKNKIYNVENGFLIDEEGTSFSKYPYVSIEDINSNSDYFFEETVPEKDKVFQGRQCVEKYYLLEYFRWRIDEFPAWYDLAKSEGKIIENDGSLSFLGNRSLANLGDYVVKKSANFFVGCSPEKFEQYYNVLQEPVV